MTFNKILSEESPLHFLPKELKKDHLIILDSLRFTLEMLDYSYNQLIVSLENISLEKENKIHFKVFHYAWSIIDHSQRFKKLYKTLNPSKESIINKLNYVDVFRNAIQHVDLNIKPTSNINMIDNGRPIYGAIKWVVYHPVSKEVYTALLISGIFNIQNISFKHHSQEGYLDVVNGIILETDTMNKKDKNEINISQLISEISEIVNQLEKSLNDLFNSENLKKMNWKSRKDVILLMKNEK